MPLETYNDLIGSAELDRLKAVNGEFAFHVLQTNIRWLRHWIATAAHGMEYWQALRDAGDGDIEYDLFVRRLMFDFKLDDALLEWQASFASTDPKGQSTSFPPYTQPHVTAQEQDEDNGTMSNVIRNNLTACKLPNET